MIGDPVDVGAVETPVEAIEATMEEATPAADEEATPTADDAEEGQA